MKRLIPYLRITALTVVAAIAAYGLTQITSIAAISLVFVPVVMLAAICWGLGPALYAAVLAIALSSFFFYSPTFSFRVADPLQVVDLVIFFCVAAVVGPLADWASRAARDAERRELHLRQLNEIGRRCAAAADTNTLPHAIADAIHGVTGFPTLLLLPRDGSLSVAAEAGASRPGTDLVAAIKQCWNGGGSPPETQSDGWLCRMIGHGDRPLGALALQAGEAAPETAFVSTLAELIAAGLERMELARQIESIRIEERAENLREAIVSSISHDLRTPLAAILGASTTLEKYGDLCSPAERGELAATIKEEAERLDRFIGKLFDLTRIRANLLQPNLEPTDLFDVIEVARRQARRSLEEHVVQVELPSDLAMVQADPVLLEQALVNILENAGRYSPPQTAIVIGATADEDGMELFVRDHGRGLTAEQSRRVFERFYRAAEGETEPIGSGLGLAISRAFVEACGGSMIAESPGPGCGTTIRIRLSRIQAHGIAA